MDAKKRNKRLQKKSNKTESDSECKTSHSQNYDSELSLALGVLTTGLYVATLYPSVPGGDSGELIAAAYELGVAHPPGYPLFTLLANCVIRLVPFGSIAWRVNLLTAVCGGMAAAFLSKLVIRLTGRLSCGAFAVGLWCWCKLTWTWSITSEVFSLNNLFITIIMKLSVDFNYSAGEMKQKISLFGSFMCGLSLCNQHTIVVYNMILILWVLLELKQNQLLSVTFLIKLGLTFALGLLPYIYLPLSAYFNQARWTWGDQRTISGFLKHLLRKEYGTFDLGKDGVQQGLFQSLQLFMSHLVSEMTVIVLILFCFGIAQAIYRFVYKKDRLYFIFALMMLVYTVFFSWRANLDVNNPLMYGVVERFWMQSDIVVIVISALGFNFIVRFFEDQFPVLRKLLIDKLIVVALIAFQLNRNYSSCNQSQNTAVYEFGMDVLNTIPNGSLVLSKGDLPSNTLRYLYLCENVRPDLLLFDQEVLTYDWSVSMMKKVYPDIVFPGDHLYTHDAIMSDGRTAFSFKRFLDVNSQSRSIYGCIGVQDHENSWTSNHDLLPFGVCSQFIKKGSSINLSQYTQQTQNIAENWSHSYNGFEDSSWERVATNEMWHAKISSAFQLYQMSEDAKIAKKKSEYLIASYQLYDSAIKRNVNIPSYWHKNFALVCERMMHIESKYNKKDILKKVILHFELFLKKDPGDADNNAIRKALVSMKTQLNGFDGKIV
ncbi:protein O-mannosyl-transferase TMEM260-like [Mytilus trossulus]|uniref:protein O-mannosyl-transferase TMEM260-like n=1 Tax=Mytilus trossulus TaxID=6551 RepID=UPI003003F548